ncbi:AAA family ATPase [Maridesulfovibrio hydrothermalis]|uniref:Protein CR006 P-loop domain-containing protein n=1 Tax=Maridesulfovibrio hydrothermalis AM13 = DSM 14728 TaxID=1121451 RepID=L0R5N3_9BACT|nr:AAA family ATPase [Maridesulfovibrio hydrothermalis]CCO21988.1 conserved protein of unknown function [Maridesulfovibrio hydrothermalis AM13 = DSM 14728]
MSGEIKRIDLIKKMAVFQDFSWSSAVRDEGDNVVEFKKINIFYGRNYSGKTTLSRIFRAMETGSISDKYTSPEFQLSFDDETNVTQKSLNGHDQVIRVFNEDFVKENLRFIVDDQHTINSFAILGEDNAKLEKEIKQHEIDLGSEEDKSGLIGKMLEAVENHRLATKKHSERSSGLEGKLRDKANKTGTGIKHNKTFGDANYNLPKIKEDIKTVTANSYTPITFEQVDKYHELLKEESKEKIPESTAFNLKNSTFVTRAKELVEKKIQAADPIQELLNDAVLEAWVRNGREHHKNKRTKCAFCGSDLPADLWEKLDKHFNQESEDLRIAIEALLTSIDVEKSRIPNLLKIKSSDFYSNFSSDLETLGKQFSAQSTAYCKTLESIKEQLEKRKSDIFTPLIFDDPTSVEQELNAVRDFYEELRNESNQFRASLSAQQSEARAALRLHEVFTFITDIKYADECKAIEALKKAMDKAEKAKSTAKAEVDTKKAKISELKAQLKDESKGADRVNDYLNNYFGHPFLSLKAIEDTSDDTSTGYRFEVTRNNKKAFHLSEGECGLIAFCYFMAKLDDVETKGSQPIIWIDDPISSLDANHIFFVYSLINAEIVKPKNYKQLFISTHNLDFLKYLKRISNDYKGKGENKVKIREFFLIERNGNSSCLSLMPCYLKRYVTEFNYLFHQIYKSATTESINDKNYKDFYSFGNNARKFFEIYLYYKYPNQGMNAETLSYFFGDEKVPAILTDRINNEYSHLAGVFERGSTPIEVPEMTTTANFILQKIREKDLDQYSALLKSIGVKDEEPQTAVEGQ